MTHYVGETEQFGPALEISEIYQICRQRPYQERRWWKVYQGRIVDVGAPGSEFFSWRGFVIRSTGDYEIYKPQMLQSTNQLVGLRDPVKYIDLVHYGELTDEVLAGWHEHRCHADALQAQFLGGPSPPGYPKKKAFVGGVSIDGIPWELHAISDVTARSVAIEAYLDEQYA